MADGLHWFVSPDGSPRGNGSRENPWNLETALAHPAGVEPGDCVWILSGEYRPRGPLQSKLQGTTEKPVVVRGWPSGDPPVVDFAANGAPFALNIRGPHVWFWGLELTNSRPDRWSDEAGEEGDPRGVGVFSEARAGVKLIHLRVHEFGTSVFESQPSALEIHGCVFFNSYWDGPDRSHGPGLYVRNPVGAPRKTIENSIVFQHGRQGLQGFGSVPFASVDVVGNTFFNNGIAQDGFHRNLMFGNASDEHRDLSFRDNVAYYPRTPAGDLFNLFGGDGGCHDIELRGNTLAHYGRGAAKIQKCDGEVIENNRFVGWTELTTFEGDTLFRGSSFRDRYPSNEYYGDGESDPSGTWVSVRSSGYLPDTRQNRGWAQVAVLNWDADDEVPVDFSALEASGAVTPGTVLQVRCVQNLAAVNEIVFQGGTWSLPMAGWTPEAPAGRDLAESPLPASIPEFGAFVVEWTVGSSVEPSGPPRIADPGDATDPVLRWLQRSMEWAGVTGAERDSDREARLLAWRADRFGVLE